MGNKVTTLYDFTLTANGSQQIQADANFYKILTASGDVSITRDGGSTVKPMRAGRGERNVKFLTLTIRDLSGAPNSGTILVGDSDFIDDTIVLSSAINVRVESPSSFFNNNAALVANTAIEVFAAGSNSNGAIVQAANINWQDASLALHAFVANATAPATPYVGRSVLKCPPSAVNGGASLYLGNAQLPKDFYIPAGLGLYFISTTSLAATTPNSRDCQYKFL